MSTVNGSIHAKRHSTQSRGNRSASDRLVKHAKKAAESLQESRDAAGAAAMETLERLRDNATEYYEDGREKVQHVEQSVEKFIHEQPLKSLLIAACAGMIIGRFWMRR